MKEDIIILAGGFGTRLKHIVPNLPKPMAYIGDKPFLDYLVRYFAKFGAKRFIFSIHYLKQAIIEYFSNFKDLKLEFKFVDEDEPLGTGGAIMNVINSVTTSENVIVINGDSFFNIDMVNFINKHKLSNNNLTIALSEVSDTFRYGRVAIDDNIITGFHEKGSSGAGLINSGIYAINVAWLKKQNLPMKFSIESDFFNKQLSQIKPNYYIHKGYFIDIGIEEDYLRAQNEMPNNLLNS